MSEVTLSLIRGAAWTPNISPEHWAAWAQGDNENQQASDAAPALSFIPAMQRRRLSRPARMAIEVAVNCLAGERADYLVWSSRHGDSVKTLSSLDNLYNSNTLSPTAFSTSVHNAAVGLYAILCTDTTPALSLSAGSESLSQACWEAASLLGSGIAQRVLIVCYDEPAATPYQRFMTTPETAFALALLVDAGGSNRFTLNTHALAPASQEDTEPQAFWRFWLRGDKHFSHGRHDWQRL